MPQPAPQDYPESASSFLSKPRTGFDPRSHTGSDRIKRDSTSPTPLMTIGSSPVRLGFPRSFDTMH